MGPDGQLIITRKIYPQRNVIRINDETCTLQKLRNITAILIDIHGQHEHQSLMSSTNHLEILDVYAGQKALQCKQKIAKYYREYKAVCERLSESMDEHMRVREKEILEYEIQEISQANIRPGEEEELATKFQRLKNANRIQDALAQALQAISQDYISEAEKKVNLVSVYDEQIADIEQQLRDISNLLMSQCGQWKIILHRQNTMRENFCRCKRDWISFVIYRVSMELIQMKLELC